MAFASPLIPVNALDELSRKTLPPSQSFCTLGADNLVVSAVKKADGDPAVVLRVFEAQGLAAETPVEFLGRKRSFRLANLLEEEMRAPERQTLQVGPYEICTARLRIR